MRTAVATVATLAVLAIGATASAQARRGEERGPVPAPGMVALGGSFGAAPPIDSSFTTGVALAANAEGYLSRRVSLRAQLSGAWWDITGRGFTGTVQPVAIDGNVVYNFEGGRIHPFVTGGIGLYHYRFAETPTHGSADKPGADVGGGVEYFVHRHTTLTGEILFHAVSEPVKSPLTTYNSSEYWTFTVGVKQYWK